MYSRGSSSESSPERPFRACLPPRRNHRHRRRRLWRIAPCASIVSPRRDTSTPRFPERVRAGSGGGGRPPATVSSMRVGSIALAVLQTLAHVDPSVMPAHRVIPVDVPEAIPVTTIAVADLPNDWRRTPPSSNLRKIGKDWLDAGETALMQVPSVIVPEESSYLVNPLHADFTRLAIRAPAPFEIDRRLFRPSS